MPHLGPLAALAAALLTAWPAAAMSLSENGTVVTLSGPIEPGDHVRFREFLALPRAVKPRVIWLSSFGGNVEAGIEIGRQVRKAGLITAVHAESGSCDSACTLIFAGGVRRHYVNGDSVFEGYSWQSGLGYHGAHRRGTRVEPTRPAEDATARMVKYYAEMGQPGAAGLATRAAFNALFRPNGKTALQLRIATSLAAP